jgi:hypothetical protein
MVTLNNFFVRKTKDGKSFIALELIGGIEMILSQATGKYYATTKKCSMPCTFDEATASKLIGSQIAGNIVKVETEPYEYTNQRTGEVLMLNYNYAYQATPQSEFVGQTQVLEMA